MKLYVPGEPFTSVARDDGGPSETKSAGNRSGRGHEKSSKARGPSADVLLLSIAVTALAVGGLLHVPALTNLSRVVWGIGTAIVLGATIVAMIRGFLRRQIGVDLIAVLAMAGALALGEYLAGAIIATMLTGGRALESLAVGRARRELTALLNRAPVVAHRRTGADIVDVDVDSVAVGDVLVVKPGEVVPADGLVASANAIVDESALTGESKPVVLEQGVPVRSGSTNGGGPFELRVALPVAQSTYAGVIRLVRAAEVSKAPFVRMAERYSVGFLALTLAACVIAWLVSGSFERSLAVLVVATPCPLLLAAPTAIIAGVSRAAKYGVIVKGGGPLELLGRTAVLLLDKTGTVTAARPQVVSVQSFGSVDSDNLVRLAASVEQLSLHPYAPSIITEARNRGLELTFPSNVEEQMGLGIAGNVEGRRIAVGQLAFVQRGSTSSAAVRALERRKDVEGSASVYLSIDGSLAGALLLQDPIRPEVPRALRSLRRAGVRRIHMVTGDHPDVAELVGDAIGVDRVYAERTPSEKVEVVRMVRTEGVTAMVGDGVNDAPALALADIGIAMGARGASAASEAADVVLTADRLEGLLHAIRIAQRTRRIALQSVVVGMGLSFVAMIAAAAGYLAVVAGAVLQEGIDILVILNALRALGGDGAAVTKERNTGDLARALAFAHRSLRPQVDELASLAARLETLPPHEARGQLESMRDTLQRQLLPHEREEQQTAYPVIGQILKGEDPTGPLVQTHHEIERLVRLYVRLVDRLPPDGPRPEDLSDVRRVLYGLHAILSLHFAQEEELYSMLET